MSLPPPTASNRSRYLEENMKLTDEYKRITEQFKDLQSKFRHFEQVGGWLVGCGTGVHCLFGR